MLKKKRGQNIFGVSFETMFAIILIIAFIIAGFFVIRHFLCTKDTAMIGLFVQDLTEDVNRVWTSQKSSSEFSYNIPMNIKWVCFFENRPLSTTGLGLEQKEIAYEMLETAMVECPDSNLMLYPVNSRCNIPCHNIPHINLSGSNPLCFKNKNGKITLRLSKELEKKYVKVSM